MKEIKITRGLTVLVDDEDYESLIRNRWTASWHTNGWYARRNNNRGNVSTYMHRQILGLIDPKIQVDHRNHDTLDNRRGNLRICTSKQNQANRQWTPNRCGFKGVSWCRTSNKFKTRIKVDQQQRIIGFFDSPEEAAAAYDIAAIESFGEFALTNSSMGLI